VWIVRRQFDLLPQIHHGKAPHPGNGIEPEPSLERHSDPKVKVRAHQTRDLRIRGLIGGWTLPGPEKNFHIHLAGPDLLHQPALRLDADDNIQTGASPAKAGEACERQQRRHEDSRYHRIRHDH
jgi:hypothetical protein